MLKHLNYFIVYLKIEAGKLNFIVQLEERLKAKCQQTNRTLYLPKKECAKLLQLFHFRLRLWK